MSSPKIIALNPSLLAKAMSLLWLLVATALVVLWQWSALAQCIVWGAFVLWMLQKQRQLRVSIACYDDQVMWCQGATSSLCQLHYLTDYWLVLKRPILPQSPLSEKLLTRLSRYRLVYKDQMSTADYRYLRSRLCVDALQLAPTQKSGSGVSK